MKKSFFKIEEGDFEEIVVIQQLPDGSKGRVENIQQQQHDILEPMRYVSLRRKKLQSKYNLVSTFWFFTYSLNVLAH